MVVNLPSITFWRLQYCCSGYLWIKIGIYKAISFYSKISDNCKDQSEALYFDYWQSKSKKCIRVHLWCRCPLELMCVPIFALHDVFQTSRCRSKYELPNYLKMILKNRACVRTPHINNLIVKCFTLWYNKSKERCSLI